MVPNVVPSISMTLLLVTWRRSNTRAVRHLDEFEARNDRAVHRIHLFPAYLAIRRIFPMLVNVAIVTSHPLDRKAPLEFSADSCSIQAPDSPHRSHCLLDRVDDKSGCAVFQYLGDRAAAECDNRGAACHRLYDDEPKRLWPVDRK